MKELIDYKLTPEKLIQRRVNNEEGIDSAIFEGTIKNYSGNEKIIRCKNIDKELRSFVVPSGTLWNKKCAPYNEFWNRIEDQLKLVKDQIDRKVNIEQFPDDYYTLIDIMRIDITRRRIQEMDYTGEMTNEITNVNYSKTVGLNEFRDYTGAFKTMHATNDTVPMIEQKTGETGSVEMALQALGHQRSLEDELYNLDIYSLEKVNRAVTRAHVGWRNDQCLGMLIALTAANAWAARQQQPAINIAGQTAEENIYQTLDTAIERLINLNDPQTEQPIDAPKLVLACRPNDVRRINKAINGVINLYRGQPSNYAALTDITEIWPYRGDVFYRGPDRIVYDGIAENTAYLFVPGSAGSPFWTLVKRQLTQEIGRGSVLQLSREQRAWYFVQTQYAKEFLGETDGCANGTGFVIEITLPDSGADET